MTKDMEFKSVVLFVSDGNCPECEKAKALITEVGLEDEIQICSTDDIERHPERNDIMMEVQYNSGALPVCICTYKHEDSIVLGGAEILRYLRLYKRFAENR